MTRLVVVVLALTAFGCQGDRVKCEKALRNYAHLVFWEEAEAEIAAAPADKRDELRKEKLAVFERNLEKGLEPMITRCVSAKNAGADCMIEAKTAKQAKACSAD